MIAELEKLKSLLDKAVISNEEYELLKKKVLNEETIDFENLTLKETEIKESKLHYKIIQAEYCDKLSKKVNREIENGWIPQGGVGVISELDKEKSDRYSFNSYNTTFYQAMIRGIS